MRILLLHGKQQSHVTFQKKVGALVKKLRKRGHVISSASEATNGPLCVDGDDEKRSWFEGDYGELPGVISRLSSLEPPFDGLIGFSQGAKLGLLIAGHARRTTLFPALKFVILASCYEGRHPESLDDFPIMTKENRIELPSLHIFGSADRFISPENSIAVSEMFEDSEIHRHDGGHHVPMRSADLAGFLDFISKFEAGEECAGDNDCDDDEDTVVPKMPTGKMLDTLPGALRLQDTLTFDGGGKEHNLYDACCRFLSQHDVVGHFEVEDELESFVCRKNPFRDFKARQVIYKLVQSNEQFLQAYERLVLDVVVPFIKCKLIEEGDVAENEETDFHYQYPPSLRLQPGGNDLHCKKHNDLEYGHQIGEVNFWLPLTDFKSTETTLWVQEKVDNGRGRDDCYHPLDINYGTAAMFHGTLLKHFVPANKSNFTRVSMDFRVGVGVHFDPDFVKEGMRVHPRKVVRF